MKEVHTRAEPKFSKSTLNVEHGFVAGGLVYGYGLTKKLRSKGRMAMKKYSNYSLIMIACCVLTFCFVARWSVVFAAETQIKLRYAGWHPITHHVTRGQEFYARLVMEKTKKVVIEVYPASQLFSDKDLVRALSTGAVDMGVMPTGLVTGQIPLLLAFDIPFIFKDRSHSHRWIDSEVSQMIDQEFEKRGYHILYWMDFGSFGFASTKPLRTLEDFKGKRIRGPGEMMVESLRALGAAPTVIGSGEVYLALQRNTIDGAISGWTSFYQRKYYEVSKYLTDADYTIGLFPISCQQEDMGRTAQRRAGGHDGGGQRSAGVWTQRV